MLLRTRLGVMPGVSHRLQSSMLSWPTCRALLLGPGLAAFLLATNVPLAHAVPRGKRPPRHVATLAQPQQNAAGADGVGRPDPSCRPHKDVLTYHGGDLVTQPDIFVFFWGPQWQNDPTHMAAAADLLAFYGDVGTSTYKCAWSESGVSGMAFGNGTLHSPTSSEVLSDSPPSPLPDSAIQSRIITEVTVLHNAAPRTDNTIYIVVPPQGVPVEASDMSTGCGGSNFVFCGYHDSFAIMGDRYRYAVLPFPCNSGGFTCFVDPMFSDVNKAFEVVASHELAETATDPDGGTVGLPGWFSDRTGNENADICASEPCIGDVTLNGHPYSVNSIWSNLAKGCVDGVPCSPPPIECTDSDPGLCVPGKGKAAGCAFEWLVDPNLTLAKGLPGGKVTCTDGQPFCDFDGAKDGTCTFHLAACFNSQDPRPEVSCTATSISSVTLTKPSSSGDSTDVANANAILGALKNVDPNSTGTQAGAQVSYSPAAGTQNACTGFLTIVVPLKVGGTGMKKGTRTVNLSLQSAAGTAHNKVKLVCLPPA